MSLLAALQALETKAETTFETALADIEGSSVGQKLALWLKAQLAQFESVGVQQVESIAETALVGVGAAIATDGNIGAAISAGLSTAEATAVSDVSADAKNALYSAVSAGTAYLQVQQANQANAPTTAPITAAS